jgi:CHAT domain-containing protein/tetratricopeptide (TPR) repeat protein
MGIDSRSQNELGAKAASLRDLAASLNQERRPDALAPALQAVEIEENLARENPERFHPDLARSLHVLAIAWRSRGRLAEAIGNAARATEIFRGAATDDPETFEPELASCLNSLANFHRAMRNLEPALTAAREASKIRCRLARQDRGASLRHHAMSRGTLAIILVESGKREEALVQALQAEGLYAEVMEAEPHGDAESDHAGAINNAANILLGLGRGREALARIRTVAEIYGRVAKTETPAAVRDHALALNNLATILGAVEGAEGRAEAVRAAEQAAEIFRGLAKMNEDAFLPEYAGALNTLANVLSESGCLDLALPHAQEFAAILRRLAAGNPAAFLPDYARALSNLAGRLYELKQRRESEAKFAEAQAIHDSLPALLRESLIEDRLKLHLNMGGLYREEDAMLGWPDYRAAREALRRAREEAERFRGSFQNAAHRQRVHGQWMVAYEMLMATCVDLADTTDDPDERESALREAMETAEASRARHLRELLAEEENVPMCDENLWREYLAGKSELRQAEEQDAMEWMQTGAGQANPGSATTEVMRQDSGARRSAAVRGPDFGAMCHEAPALFQPTAAAPIQARQEKLLAEIREQHPGFQENQPLPPLGFDEVRRLVPGDGSAALVQFFLTGRQSRTRSVALVTLAHSVFAVRLSDFNAEEGWRIAREWQQLTEHGAGGDEASVANRGHWGDEIPRFMDQVAKAVVAPLWEALERHGASGSLRRLVLSPHLALGFLPLHACPLPGSPDLLGQRVEISYTPSLTMHRHCVGRTAAGGGEALLTANPTGDLGFSEVELAALRVRYPAAAVLRGEDVRREALLRRLGEASAWFYTGHAAHCRERPLDSALLLVDAGLPGEWLTLRDMFTRLRLRPGARLVILGCQTAYFSPNPADEPTDLATGLLFAGARHVVSTLWRVNDLSCALWSDRFHAELQAGKSVVQAVREAGRWLRGDPQIPDSIRSGRDLWERVLPPLFARLDPRLDLIVPAADAGGTFDRERVNALETCRHQALEIVRTHPESAPFASPYHWAPFVVNGAA